MATTPTIDSETQDFIDARKAYWLSEQASPEGDMTPELAETMALQEACEEELARLGLFVNTDNPEALRALLVALLPLGKRR